MVWQILWVEWKIIWYDGKLYSNCRDQISWRIVDKWTIYINIFFYCKLFENKILWWNDSNAVEFQNLVMEHLKFSTRFTGFLWFSVQIFNTSFIGNFIFFLSTWTTQWYWLMEYILIIKKNPEIKAIKNIFVIHLTNFDFLLTIFSIFDFFFTHVFNHHSAGHPAR